MEDVEYFLDKSKAKECFDMLDLDKDGKVNLQVLLAPLLPWSVLRKLQSLFVCARVCVCACVHVSARQHQGVLRYLDACQLCFSSHFALASHAVLSASMC